MKTLLLAAVLTFAVSAFAGEKGNGGYSVVCRNDQGQIKSAELLDIYEGREIYKKKYDLGDKSVEQIIDVARNRLAVFGTLLAKIDKEIEIIHQNTIMIGEGNVLEFTDDAFPRISKRGCKFEQAANYDNSGEVLILEEIYNKLDNVNKAALILHEAMYSFRRKALSEDKSINTRKLIGQLVASDPDEKLIDRFIGDSIYRPNSKKECGLEGSINERIESCSYVSVAMSGMVLVTRTNENKEIWLDEANKLLLSDRLSMTMNFVAAKAICESNLPELGNLGGMNWRLPVVEEYSRMSQVYMQVLPNMSNYTSSHWFWTSSVKGRMVYIFNGSDGTIGASIFKGSQSGSVRCVASL